MIPKTLSATAVQVAEGCLARFAAENINKAGKTSNDAALLGSTCHSALEDFVRMVFIVKERQPDKKLLLDLYRMHAIANFGSTDFDMFNEGLEMLDGWYDRTVELLAHRTVLSAEEKLTFPLKTSIGDIPFTYIMDRLDQLDENTWEIVDYKTIRWGFNPEDLAKKMQARVYALALSIKLRSMGIDNRNAKVWVRFDLLRHSSIARPFTHGENLATYKKLQEIAERIIGTDEATAPRTLNAECNYCVIKAGCPELQRNINAGGSFGLTNEQLIDRRAEMEYQRKAVVAAIEEMDSVIIEFAKEEDIVEYKSGTNRMLIQVSSRKGVDADMVERVVGAETFEMYGGKSLTMANFNKMLKDPAIELDKKNQLKGLVQQKVGEPRVKIEPRGFTEDE